MKKIVPFTKDLMFKTKIGEITSIALDNTLKLESELVSGEFIVSGNYKMLDLSQIEEEFKFNIPVDIAIDPKYETRDCLVSIDDFSYEIINEEKLKVNISVMLDNLNIKEDPIEKIEVSLPENDNLERDFELLDDDLEKEIDTFLDDSVLDNLEIKTNITNNITTNSFNNNDLTSDLFKEMDDVKEFSIYRVYTMKEDDTLELIYEKFNTTKEILSDYNDLNNLTVGMKLIIPSQDE